MSENLSVKKRIVMISNLLRLEKTGKNTFSNYDYFKPDLILQALNPLLEQYNLITIFNLKTHDTKEGYYTALLTIEDTESNDKVDYNFEIGMAEVKGANKSQNSGATFTYAKRYSLMNAFNIADDSVDFDSKKNKNNSGGNVQNKDKKDLKTRINDMLVVFQNELSVTKEQIEKYINKKVEVFNDADISKLSAAYGLIKTNKKKKEEYFK